MCLSIVPGSDNQNLLFHVEGSGVGISADKVQKLFQPFQPAISRAGDGAGLGLAICNRLAESLGGSVTVQSTLSQGSCFILSIPLKLVDEKGFYFPDSAVAEGVGQVSESMVLVAEDDINRQVSLSPVFSFSSVYLKQLDRALELGDVETIRQLLVAEQKNSQKEACQQWLQCAIECIDQLDLDGVTDLLRQLRDSERVAL